MAYQTTLRQGTAATWTSTNPTLAQGEIGVESDTFQFKIGTGSTAWTSLGYSGATGPAQTLSYRSLGDGSDGNVTISSGTTTLTRDMFYNNLTINGTGQINTNGYKIFVKGYLDLTAAPVGAINDNGLNGSAASGATPGATLTAPTPGTVGTGGNGFAGGAGSIYIGSNGTTGGSPLPSSFGNGGTQNTAGSGGSGLNSYTFTVTAGQTASVGAVYSTTGTDGHIYNFIVTTALLVAATSLVTIGVGPTPPATSGTLTFVSGTGTGPITYSAVGAAITTGGLGAGGGGLTANVMRRWDTNFIKGVGLIGGGVGGGGGGGGGGDGTNSGGGGGGGGQGGGVVALYANTIIKSTATPAGVIQANGGTGGAGGNGAQVGVTGGGGGGTGGAGGWVIIYYNNLAGPIVSGAIQSASGPGGNGGNGFGFVTGFLQGKGGVGGAASNAGRITLFQITTSSCTEIIASQLVSSGINPELNGNAAVGALGGSGGTGQMFSANL